MSVSGKKGVGIPIILLHDAEGGIVTIELKDGSTYRGTLEDAQDNMNCLMKNVTRISSDGSESRLEMAYVRGSQIGFIVLPEMLKHAPFFNRIKLWRKYKGHAVMGAGGTGPSSGRGNSASILQKSSQRRAQVERTTSSSSGAGMGRGAPSGSSSGAGGMYGQQHGGMYGQPVHYSQSQGMQGGYPSMQQQQLPPRPYGGPSLPPGAGYQPPGAGYQPPVAGYQPPGAGYQPPREQTEK